MTKSGQKGEFPYLVTTETFLKKVMFFGGAELSKSRKMQETLSPRPSEGGDRDNTCCLKSYKPNSIWRHRCVPCVSRIALGGPLWGFWGGWIGAHSHNGIKNSYNTTRFRHNTNNACPGTELTCRASANSLSQDTTVCTFANKKSTCFTNWRGQAPQRLNGWYLGVEKE